MYIRKTDKFNRLKYFYYTKIQINSLIETKFRLAGSLRVFVYIDYNDNDGGDDDDDDNEEEEKIDDDDENDVENE